MNEFKEHPANKKSISGRKLVFGVGRNDAEYMVRIECDGKFYTCPYYKKWVHMLERCYSGKYQKKMPSYIGCHACKDWLLFSNFRVWMKDQDWADKELDKDILFQGNKKYSPETCLFVPSYINSLICDCKARRGSLPQGVSFDKNRNTYNSSVSFNGESIWIGRFKTPEEASSEYRKMKYSIIRSIAAEQSGELRHALMNFKIE